MKPVTKMSAKAEKAIKNMLKAGDFVEIKDNFLIEHSIKKGDTLYLAGDSIIPNDENDIYNMRRVFVAAQMDGEHVNIVKQPFMCDPKRLKKVCKAKQEKLNKIFEEDYKED